MGIRTKNYTKRINIFNGGVLCSTLFAKVSYIWNKKVPLQNLSQMILSIGKISVGIFI